MNKQQVARLYYRAGAILYLLAVIMWFVALNLAHTLQPRMETSVVLAFTGLLILASIAAEMWPLQVEVKRNTVLITISEAPIVLGLLNFPLLSVLFASLVSALMVFAARRDALRHIVINSSVVAAETGFAALGLMAAQALFGTEPGVKMLGVLVFVPLSTIGSALIVDRLHRIIDGRREGLDRSNLLLSAGTTVSVTILALVVYLLIQMGTVGLIAAAGLIAVAIVFYVAYSRSLRRQHDYARTHEISRGIPSLVSDFTRWPDLLEKIRDEFNAEVALFLPSSLWSTQEPVIAVPIGEPEDIPVPPAATDRLRQLAPLRAAVDDSDDHEFELQARAAEQIMLIRLELVDDFLGFLELRDPRTRWGRFTEAQLNQLDNLGTQIAAAWVIKERHQGGAKKSHPGSADGAPRV